MGLGRKLWRRLHATPRPGRVGTWAGQALHHSRSSESRRGLFWPSFTTFAIAHYHGLYHNLPCPPACRLPAGFHTAVATQPPASIRERDQTYHLPIAVLRRVFPAPTTHPATPCHLIPHRYLRVLPVPLPNTSLLVRTTVPSLPHLPAARTAFTYPYRLLPTTKATPLPAEPRGRANWLQNGRRLTFLACAGRLRLGRTFPTTLRYAACLRHSTICRATCPLTHPTPHTTFHLPTHIFTLPSPSHHHHHALPRHNTYLLGLPPFPTYHHLPTLPALLYHTPHTLLPTPTPTPPSSSCLSWILTSLGQDIAVDTDREGKLAARYP